MDPRIEYELFTDPSPSAACGHFQCLSWDFYARWDHWHFAISRDAGVRPEASKLRDLPPDKRPLGVFFREGKYGQEGQSKGSYMPDDEKFRIIRECIREFEDRPT